VKIRKLHRIIGVILILPFFGWALTGLVFFVKPGYAAAYETLAVKTYKLETSTTVTPDPSWREFRFLRTILGNHLLVRTESGWKQLDPVTKEERRRPTEAELRALIGDAITSNSDRYGDVTQVVNDTARTTTGVEVTLDWPSLTLQQKGKDTARIDALYKVHYLQWTGVKSLDKILGFVGLVLVMSLTVLGAVLAVKR
jgi:hypothetical protein